MPAGVQDFDDFPGDAMLALDRLIGIGVGAQRDRFAGITRLAEFGAQALGGVALGEQARLEIQPRRKIQIGRRGPRIAVIASAVSNTQICSRLQRLIARETEMSELNRPGF